MRTYSNLLSILIFISFANLSVAINSICDVRIDMLQSLAKDGFLRYNYVTIFEVTRMGDFKKNLDHVKKIRIMSTCWRISPPPEPGILIYGAWGSQRSVRKIMRSMGSAKIGHLGRFGGLIWYGEYLGASEVGLLAGREQESGFSTNPLREVKTQRNPTSFVVKTRLRELT